MAVSLREYRARIRSTESMKKITRAMELIAASRIIKAQQRAQAAAPYARELTRAVSAVATFSNVDHPLTTEKPNPKRAAVLLITSDRGQAGAYSANVIREGERLHQMLREDQKEIVSYLSGRKGVAYYTFRQRELAQSWTGDSDNPSFARAREIADVLIEAFLTPTEEGGVDEIHIVFTRFVSMLTQRPDVIRLLPLEVIEGEEAPAADDVLPLRRAGRTPDRAVGSARRTRTQLIPATGSHRQLRAVARRIGDQRSSPAPVRPLRQARAAHTVPATFRTCSRRAVGTRAESPQARGKPA